MPVIKVETIAHSKLALVQSSIRPNPQKQNDIEIRAYFWRQKMTQEMTAARADPTIDERETYLVFLRVIPNDKKAKIRVTQQVESANPA